MSGSVAEAAPPRRAVLLVNPEARRGDQRIDGIVARLGAGGIALTGEPASSPDELGRIVRDAPDPVDTVIVCGGDGSLCRSAPALLATGAALGIMPMGTANDLARTLGIPDDLEQAADIVIAGHRRRIDLGSVNGHPFFNVASIGLATDLARELSSDLKQRWGRLGYAVAAVRALAKARRFSAWISENGDVMRTRTLQVAVGNGRFYGGGTVVARRRDDRRRAPRPLQPRVPHRLAPGADAHRLPLGRAWRLVGGAHTARHRVRDPHQQPASGQRRRRAAGRHAGGLQGDAEGARGLCAGEGVIPSQVIASVRRRAGFRRRSCPLG